MTVTPVLMVMGPVELAPTLAGIVVFVVIVLGFIRITPSVPHNSAVASFDALYIMALVTTFEATEFAVAAVPEILIAHVPEAFVPVVLGAPTVL